MNVAIRNGECKHVTIHHYPDGQKNVTLDMEWFNNPKDPVEITCNIRNFSDLELLLSIVAALRKNDFYIIAIKFNYLFGLRSDRAFETGMPNYVRDVLAPVILELDIPNKAILMPHSHTGCEILKSVGIAHYPEFDGYVVIGADESAYSRQSHNSPFEYFFIKSRLENEMDIRLKHEFYFDIENAPDHHPILIVDDLCDGGATFIAIAKYLDIHFPDRQKHLYVTHGLFTKGLDHVAAYYDKIITTNSYQDFDPHPKLQVINIWA